MFIPSEKKTVAANYGSVGYNITFSKELSLEHFLLIWLKHLYY